MGNSKALGLHVYKVMANIKQSLLLLFICFQRIHGMVEKVLNTRYANMKYCLFVWLVWCFTSQSTAMVMLGQSVHLTTLFPGQA